MNSHQTNRDCVPIKESDFQPAEPLQPLHFLAPTFFYDGQCPLCRSLAAWGNSLGMTFLPWEENRQYFANADQEPDRLRAWNGLALLSDTEAWEFLLSSDPRLEKLGWIAKKLGWSKPLAKTFESTGRWLRWVCPRCPGRKSSLDF